MAVGGLPDRLHVDNGPDFRSRAFKRGHQDAGIAIEWRPPSEPHFGGHVESDCTQLGRLHLLPGTTFSNAQELGEYNSKRHAALTCGNSSGTSLDAIEAAGASLLYLPPYSSEFNPIENAFAKLKALLSAKAERTSRLCGTRSARSSTSSPQPNVPTTSKPQDMNRIKQDVL